MANRASGNDEIADALDRTAELLEPEDRRAVSGRERGCLEASFE